MQGAYNHTLQIFNCSFAACVARCNIIIIINPGGFGSLVKYPALVLHYSGAAAAAFSPHTNRGKLLQHKLIRVQCTKKKVPEYRYPLYRSTGIGFKKLFLSIVFTILKKSYF